MKAHMCSVCGFLYNEESADKNIEGVVIPFEELDDDWICLNCGVNKDLFVPADSEKTEYVPNSEKVGSK